MLLGITANDHCSSLTSTSRRGAAPRFGRTTGTLQVAALLFISCYAFVCHLVLIQITGARLVGGGAITGVTTADL